MTIEEMRLAPIAEEAARQLLRKHPNIEFTSGRRDVAQQAHAMAANIVALHDRNWIGKTYLAGAKLQAWVDSHPTAVTVEQITTGLVATMSAMPEEELLRISRHLTGRAFDIRPVVQNAAAIKNDIRALPGLQKFLEKEGGHVRWHAQFE
jgi:hypothetical protein